MSKLTDEQKKEIVLEYFADVPVYRYAAMVAGVSEDTLARWRKDDEEFAESLNQVKARWVRKRVADVKADWALERLEREIFQPPKQQLEHSGGDDPIRIILGKYGLPGGADARQDDDSVSGSSENPV